VLEFCKKEGFPVTKGIDFPIKTVRKHDNEPVEIIDETQIDRGENYMGAKYWWRVTYYGGFGFDRTDIYIDGQTGKVLSRDFGVITP